MNALWVFRHHRLHAHVLSIAMSPTPVAHAYCKGALVTRIAVSRWRRRPSCESLRRNTRWSTCVSTRKPVFAQGHHDLPHHARTRFPDAPPTATIAASAYGAVTAPQPIPGVVEFPPWALLPVTNHEAHSIPATSCPVLSPCPWPVPFWPLL